MPPNSLMLRLILPISFAVLLSGCIMTRPVSTTPGSAALVIDDVPVRRWGDNTCGSGALAAVLNRYGDPVKEEELDAVLDKGLHGGVVSVDLLIEARRRGYDAELVVGSEELVRSSLLAGKPVILMLRVVNLPRRRNDLYHYVVADGFDAARDLVRLQFGRGKPIWTPLAKIDGNWKATKRATLLVHGRSATAIDSKSLLKRAVALQESGNVRGAIDLYRQLLSHEPDSSLLQTNLANALREAGERDAAEQSYRRAIELDPKNRDALNNLAWLLFEGQRFGDAAPLAREAASIDGPDRHLVLDTLGEIELALANCHAAADVFRKALESAPGEAREQFASKLRNVETSCR